jgi:hypothetical protein
VEIPHFFTLKSRKAFRHKEKTNKEILKEILWIACLFDQKMGKEFPHFF